jgi:chorismate mutase
MSEIGRTLWMRVKEHLDARLAELHEEVRAYPTPIARCDDQLPKLLERRAAAQRRARLAEDQAVEGFDDARFAALIEELIGDDGGDPECAALREEARALRYRISAA